MSLLQSGCEASSSDHHLADRPPSFETLPSELIQLIIAHLSTATLRSVALVSRTLYRHAADILWQNVCLSDQARTHITEDSGPWGERDEHDDTPIIQKLYILATNPSIAAKVQVLTHRCHLPTPNLFTEIPKIYFHGHNISQDARLFTLLRLAIRNLVNVHTLRIIYGHWRLANALIAGLLHHERPRHEPLRKLWFESCCLTADPKSFLLPGQCTGLESIRVRRLANESLHTIQRRGMRYNEFTLSRSGNGFPMHNGAGNWMTTTVQLSDGAFPQQLPQYTTEGLRNKAQAFDAIIWGDLPQIKSFAETNTTHNDEILPMCLSVEPLTWLLHRSESSLTSLNLDWILWRRKDEDPYDNSTQTFDCLKRLRFPHLRAFQVRNAVLLHTELPEHVYLLEDTFLDFMENHPKIQCLAWPVDRFYSHDKPSVEVQIRSRKLIAHLATMLTDLRLDVMFANGEPFTDVGISTIESQGRIRRRRFIAEFAVHMRRVEQIKLEGGIPRDEKREIFRALHWCPLRKVVMIGVNFPVGNTWGSQGLQLKALDPGADSEYELEEEDLDGIIASYKRGDSMPKDFEFEPQYGWPPQGPLLQTIAMHHASRIEEIKICGYNGCPILSSASPITGPLLIGLRHFENLKQLVISFWLLTWFEDSYRDVQIIQSWIDTRSPTSTALTVVTPPTSPARELPVDPGQFPHFNNNGGATTAPNFNRWAVILKTQFSPSALAYRVARDIGPFLNPVAKAKPGGVSVRASFSLGERDDRRNATSDIFDLDVRIGANDQVLEFIGPREEGEKGRRRIKLENRRWF